MARYLCELCNAVVKIGDKHYCFFKDNEAAITVRHGVEKDRKRDKATSENRGNFKEENECEVAPHTRSTPQASTSRVHSVFSAGNKEVHEGSSDVPLDLTNRPLPPQVSIHKANSEGLKGKSTELQKNADAVPGTSTICHHSTGPAGETQYKCDSCTYQSKYKHNFLRHQKKHWDVKPFVCDTCRKGFTQKHSLAMHERIHTGEKPYVCDTCGKLFTRKQHLNSHMRTHTDEKSFVCNTCGKGFAWRGKLAIHERIHTGEKPYVCDTCGKRYTKQQKLQRHVRTHT